MNKIKVPDYIGLKITGEREMTQEELDKWDWLETGGTNKVLILEDGSTIIPMMDSEGNGLGQLVREMPDGNQHYI
jgi:hypothetical protein